MKYIYAAIIIIVLVVIFVFSYLLNKKTPKPDGCEDVEGTCEGCQILSCSHNPKNNEGKENN